jgi:hypothetical protein
LSYRRYVYRREIGKLPALNVPRKFLLVLLVKIQKTEETEQYGKNNNAIAHTLGKSPGTSMLFSCPTAG